MFENLIKKYVIARGDRSGVFTGVLEEVEGRTVKLSQCRRIWTWDGAASISEMALSGVKNPESCKFTVALDEIVLLDIVEIIPTTAKAEEIIRGVPAWTA